MTRLLLSPLLVACIAVQTGCDAETSMPIAEEEEHGASDAGDVGEGDAGAISDPRDGADGGCEPPAPMDSGIEIDTATEDDSLFDVQYELSAAIPTVGVVTWSIREAVTSASIVFGPAGGDFEQAAECDLNEPDHRTLILGMKPDSTYRFAIVAARGSRAFTSAVYEITTGPQRTGLPIPRIQRETGCGVPFGGFTIGCIDGLIGEEDDFSIVYIFDKDGDHVWWYEFPVADCSRARMSFDGKRMWGGNSNVTGNKGALFSVTMDGLDEQLFTEDNVPGIEKRHHDFAVLENGNILYFERDPLPPGKGATPFGTYINDEADTIYELDPTTQSKTPIFYQGDHFSAAIKADGSHTNAISYVPHLDAVAFSMKNIDTIAVVSYPEGDLLTVYGGLESAYDGMDWDAQHDFQVLPDGLVLFNNNGPTDGSAALKYTIENGTASLDWAYSPGIQSNAWGSAVELANGNVLVVYSNNNLIHELTPEGELIESTEIADIAYVVRRESLYGPPPPWDR